jgi:glycosyltransferase involved in cell wall biosynthesis
LVSVSVVMPSYNHEKYLPEAINSVLNQTCSDLELIIVDDCSTDSSQKIIDTFQHKDKRVKPIFHNQNLGISQTYNDGVKHAQGKFVAFIDSDDVWVETKLDKQLAILKTNEDLIVWSEGEIIDQNGISNGKTFTQIENGSGKKKSGNIFQELLSTDNFVFDSSMILKKENLPQRGFDEDLRYLNDYRFVVDLAREHEFYFQEEPLAKYRVHGKNTIFNKSLSWHQDRIVFCQQIINEYGTVIPKKIRSNLLFRMGWAYAELGDTKRARQSIFKAFKTRPYGKKAFLYLVVALTGLRIGF